MVPSVGCRPGFGRRAGGGRGRAGGDRNLRSPTSGKSVHNSRTGSHEAPVDDPIVCAVIGAPAAYRHPFEDIREEFGLGSLASIAN